MNEEKNDELPRIAKKNYCFSDFLERLQSGQIFPR